MPSPRTYREREALDFIKGFHDEYKLMPTVREIAKALGVTKTAAYKYLIRLRAEGMLTWEPRKQRGLRVVEGNDG